MTTSSASLFNGKHVVVALVITFIPMLPSLLLAPLGWGDATGPFLLATMAALMASVFAGIRLGLIVTAGLVVADVLALPAAPSPVWAGLVMAATALLYGLSARRGLTSMIATAPIAVAFTLADPPTLQQGSMLADALALALFVGLGGLWGTGFGSLLGRKVPRKVPPLSKWTTAVVFAVTMAIVAGVTMGIVVATGIGHTGAWILLTILIVAQPAMGQTFRKSLERALGTLLGFGIALVVALLVGNTTLLLVLGIAFLTFAVYVKLDSRSTYWQFTTFLTPGIVLAEGSAADAVSLDIDRLWASFIGVGVALVLVLVFRMLGVRDKEVERADDQDGQVSVDPTATS
jgi:uncharacterized protein (DUF486 family)